MCTIVDKHVAAFSKHQKNNKAPGADSFAESWTCGKIRNQCTATLTAEGDVTPEWAL